MFVEMYTARGTARDSSSLITSINFWIDVNLFAYVSVRLANYLWYLSVYLRIQSTSRCSKEGR